MLYISIFRIVPICYYYLIKLSVFIGDNVRSLQSLTTEKTKVELIYLRNAGGFLEIKTSLKKILNKYFEQILDCSSDW